MLKGAVVPQPRRLEARRWTAMVETPAVRITRSSGGNLGRVVIGLLDECTRGHIGILTAKHNNRGAFQISGQPPSSSQRPETGEWLAGRGCHSLLCISSTSAADSRRSRSRTLRSDRIRLLRNSTQVWPIYAMPAPAVARRHSLVIGLACPCDRHHMTNLVLHHNRFGLRMLFEPSFPSRDPRLTWSNNVWHEMGLRRSWTCRSRQVR